MTAADVDVLIVGAGLSGIGAAVHLQDKHPQRSYLILEAREAIGGTWDLFRYPGIRSDSDLHTFSYAFKPWLEDRAIADGASILRYIRETAAEHGVDRQICFGHRVRDTAWSSAEGRWTVQVDCGPDAEPVTLTAQWLFCAGGYYRYDRAYVPELPGIDAFDGEIVHPQFWPATLDCAGRHVIVIGSGATAMTIVPALADSAVHVTLLQRTPTYVLPIPAVDPIARWLRRLLGRRAAHRVVRAKNVRLQRLLYRASRRHPERVRRLIRAVNRRALPDGFDIDTHFHPPYDPWDQRLCVVPDGDLFRAIRAGAASVVTDRIARFVADGVELDSGVRLKADLVVTATGLELLALGGISYSVDGRPIHLSDTVTYKGMMLTGMPNFVYAIGYTNASWTPKVDLVCEHFCRVLALMDAEGWAWCVPEAPDPRAPTRPLLDLAAGYVLRSVNQFPRQGDGPPWELSMDYLHDRRVLLREAVGDHMRFEGARTPGRVGPAPASRTRPR